MSISQPQGSLLPLSPIVNSPPHQSSKAGQKSMIHHKPRSNQKKIIVSYSSLSQFKRYGVSTPLRLLSPGLFIKRYDQIRDFLEGVLGLTTAQREIVLRILRLWAYYGLVYPKESQITQEPGCSKATFWRTVRQLRELHLVQVVNRYVVRPHAQISNLYRLDRLALVVARYLAEHGIKFPGSWACPYLAMAGQAFWGSLYQSPVAITGPP